MLKMRSLLDVSYDETVKIAIISERDLERLIQANKVPGDYVDYTMTRLAPPQNLLDAFTQNTLSWKEFLHQYKKHLATPDVSFDIRNLSKCAKSHDITIMTPEDLSKENYLKIVYSICTKPYVAPTPKD